METNSVIQLDRAGNGDAEVHIDGELLSPEPSLQVVGLEQNIGRAYFNFGYPGRGTGQLALAMLLDAGVSAAEAKEMRTAFKFEVLAGLDMDEALL